MATDGIFRGRRGAYVRTGRNTLVLETGEKAIRYTLINDNGTPKATGSDGSTYTRQPKGEVPKRWMDPDEFFGT